VTPTVAPDAPAEPAAGPDRSLHSPATDSRADVDALGAAVSAMWDRRKDEILQRVAVLEDAVLALLDGALDDDRRRDAVRVAHKLAGAVGTFGFPEGSRLARETEQLLDTPGMLDIAEVPRLSALVVELRRELEGPASMSGGSGPPPPPVTGSLLIVDDDEHLAGSIAAAAAAEGLGSRVVTSPADARLAVAQRRPDLVLLDPGFPDGTDDAFRLLDELTSATVPVLVFTVRSTFTARVEAARRGVTGFLDKSVPLPEVLEVIQEALAGVVPVAATVLAVDDDPVVLEGLDVLLGEAGFVVHTLTDPRRIFDVLESAAPDLLVLDFHLPHADGAELCRALRNDPRWATLPVVFLSGTTDAVTRQRMLDAGGDDHLTKPVIGRELVSRIRNRMDRLRPLQQLADEDGLTGILNRRRSRELIGQRITTARHFGRPLSLAVIDLDEFKAVNDRYGHAAGDSVLRRLSTLLSSRFRGEDVVARWGGEEFAVCMYDTSREDAVRRVAELLEAFRAETFFVDDGSPFTAAFSAGVAQYPEDGADVESVYRSADRALYRAKSEGRGRVRPAGGSPTGTAAAGATVVAATVVDVALVEDDEVLAPLILHALETRGYSTCWIQDGQEAADALTGSLVPRLTLLDWDLPGLNGLAVLGAMARSGALERTRAVMLTARSTEAETLQAMELGAVDHVAKPFSLPVLMQRVRAELDR
jgi:diguanylate cyclase (GGDEF)-like protein